MSVQRHEVREHMTVVGRDGGHVGTVDRVEGDRIKLTKQDDPDGSAQHHHFIPLNDVAALEGGQVRLTTTTSAARDAAVAQSDSGDGKGGAAGRLSQAAGAALDTARARAAQGARDAGDWAEDAYHEAEGMARNASASVSSIVEEQPMVTAVIAGALGFALGALAASSWRRSEPDARQQHWTRHGRERRNPDGGRVGASTTVEGSAEYSGIPTN